MMDTTNTKMVDTVTTDWQSEAYVAALEEDEDGVFVATLPAFRGCITQGNTEEEALQRLGDALCGWLEVAEKRGLETPW